MRIGDDIDEAMTFIQSMPLIHEMLVAASGPEQPRLQRSMEPPTHAQEPIARS